MSQRLHILPGGHHLGWRRPLLGQQAQFTLSQHKVIRSAPIADKSDLTSVMPSVWDQLREGACTGHGSLEAYLASLIRAGQPQFMPSRQAQYNWTRIAEGTLDQDAGASVADAIATIKRCGVAYESDFAYSEELLTVTPPLNLPIHGHSIDDYGVDCSQLDQVLAALSAGYPVVFGATVFPEIENATKENPVVAMPRRGFLGFGKEQSIGGHCMVFIGHDNSTRRLRFRNSWGTDWGLDGDGFFPYEYLQYCDDAHVIDQAVES